MLEGPGKAGQEASGISVQRREPRGSMWMLVHSTVPPAAAPTPVDTSAATSPDKLVTSHGTSVITPATAAASSNALACWYLMVLVASYRK